MGKPGTYYNPKQQVTTLEALIKSLPDPSAPLQRRHLATPTRTARPLPSERADELVAAYVAGDPIRDLVERFRVSHETVNQIVRNRGIPLRPRGLSPEQIDEAVQLYGDGWSLARIGKRMDVDARTVHRRLIERGARMRGQNGAKTANATCANQPAHQTAPAEPIPAKSRSLHQEKVRSIASDPEPPECCS